MVFPSKLFSTQTIRGYFYENIRLFKVDVLYLFSTTRPWSDCPLCQPPRTINELYKQRIYWLISWSNFSYCRAHKVSRPRWDLLTPPSGGASSFPANLGLFFLNLRVILETCGLLRFGLVFCRFLFCKLLVFDILWIMFCFSVLQDTHGHVFVSVCLFWACFLTFACFLFVIYLHVFCFVEFPMKRILGLFSVKLLILNLFFQIYLLDFVK